jgi:flagellar basal-body rod protein FlgB
MDLSNLPLFAALSRKMEWLSDRQKVLSENVANADTPHYQAADLRPLDFKKELEQTGGRLELVSTDPQHITTAPSATGVADDALVKTADDREISGNTVSLEDEMIKVSQTAADYQLMTNLYKKQIGMLKEAIGRSGASG